MDFLSHFLSILVLLVIVVLYRFKKTRTKCPKTKPNQAPEPSGAFPIIGHLHLLGGDLPIARTLGAMADKHGPVFSLQLGNHRGLVVSSHESVKECFTTHDRIFASRPNIAFGKYIAYDNASFGLAPYGPYWRDIRKMVTLELFTNHQLERLKHVRVAQVDSSIKDLYSLCITNTAGLTPKVDIGTWFEHVTFNIITRLLAGKMSPVSTCSERTDGVWHFKEAIQRALYLSGVFVLSDFIPWLEWVDFGGYVKSMKQTAMEIDEVLSKWLGEHIEKRKKCENNSEEDLMDVMLSSLPEDTNISGYKRDTIIKATILILIATGSESTAETLTWALSLLLNNRHVLKRAHDELDIHVGRDKWVEESDIKNLTYLQAIIKETLRLYPPGPLAGPREAMEDCYVSGYHVPKGTRLIVNLLKMQRDPRIWSNPNEFEPERFLTSHVNVNFRGQNYEYIPFSSGRRMCPGLTYGLQVIHLTLARLLQGFDLTIPIDGPVDMAEGLGIALPKLKPLEVVLTPRLPFELYQISDPFELYQISDLVDVTT